MNERQAEALKRLLEAGHPDAGITVTAGPGGVEVTITGPAASPASARVGDVRLILADNGPFLRRLLGNAAGA